MNVSGLGVLSSTGFVSGSVTTISGGTTLEH